MRLVRSLAQIVPNCFTGSILVRLLKMSRADKNLAVAAREFYPRVTASPTAPLKVADRGEP
jgi:hypothetical protein